MTEFYVAFSKTGTNTFITASKEFKRDSNASSFMLDGFNFTKAQSRMSSLRGATKLHTAEISNNSTPQEVLTFFDKLRANGWNVDDTAYVNRNNLTRMTVPVVQDVTDNSTENSGVETTTQIVVENDLTTSVAEVAPVEQSVGDALAKQIEQRTPEIKKVFESSEEIAKPKGLQPLGEMQQKFISILGMNSPDNIWTIQNEVTVPQMKHLLESKYRLVMSPSDIKRVLVGLVKRDLIKFNGIIITKA